MIHVLAYLRKDFLLEFRRGYALGGLVVFVLCIVYIIYLSLGKLEARTWIALYWIAFLFMSVHTILKGFSLEQNARYLYYYTLARPETVFFGKWIYHTCALIVLGLLMYVAMTVIAGNPFDEQWIFLLTLVCGAVGISLCFTFVSAIAVKSDQSATLMTILSFPLIIPILLHLIRMSLIALPDNPLGSISGSLLTLGGIYLLLMGMGLLLFPYLWRS